MHSEKERKTRRETETQRTSLKARQRPTLQKREKENSERGTRRVPLKQTNTHTRPEHSSSRVHGVIVLALLGIERNYYNSKRTLSAKIALFLAKCRVAPVGILRLQGRPNK